MILIKTWTKNWSRNLFKKPSLLMVDKIDMYGNIITKENTQSRWRIRFSWMKLLTQRYKGYIQWLGKDFGPFQSLSKSLFLCRKFAQIASQSEVFFIDKFWKWLPTAHYVYGRGKPGAPLFLVSFCKGDLVWIYRHVFFWSRTVPKLDGVATNHVVGAWLGTWEFKSI